MIQSGEQLKLFAGFFLFIAHLAFKTTLRQSYAVTHKLAKSFNT